METDRPTVNDRIGSALYSTQLKKTSDIDYQWRIEDHHTGTEKPSEIELIF